MKVAIRYFTRSGNTKKLADAIGEAIGVEAKDVSAPLEEPVDILFLGSSVYAAGVDDAVKQFIADNHDKIGVLYNFSTAALISSTYKQIQKIAAAQGVKVAQEEFHCRGSFAMMHKGHPDQEDLDAAAAFAKKICE